MPNSTARGNTKYRAHKSHNISPVHKFSDLQRNRPRYHFWGSPEHKTEPAEEKVNQPWATEHNKRQMRIRLSHHSNPRTALSEGSVLCRGLRGSLPTYNLQLSPSQQMFVVRRCSLSLEKMRSNSWSLILAGRYLQIPFCALILRILTSDSWLFTWVIATQC